MFTLRAFCTVGRRRPLQRQEEKNVLGSELDLESLWKGDEQEVMSRRSHPWKRKNANGSGKSRWFHRLVVKRHPEEAAGSSAALGGNKTHPFWPGGQEEGDSALGPAASQRQAAPTQLPPPKIPKSCPKTQSDALGERPADAALGDPRGQGRSGEAGKEAEPGAGFELVFEIGIWGDAAHGATWRQGEAAARDLVAIILGRWLCSAHSSSWMLVHRSFWARKCPFADPSLWTRPL